MKHAYQSATCTGAECGERSGPADQIASSWLSSLREKLALWRSRTRGRRELLRMDDRALRDIGISRYEASREARKYFWQS